MLQNTDSSVCTSIFQKNTAILSQECYKFREGIRQQDNRKQYFPKNIFNFSTFEDFRTFCKAIIVILFYTSDKAEETFYLTEAQKSKWFADQKEEQVMMGNHFDPPRIVVIMYTICM